MGALAAAASIAQISAIKSASFSGGGGGTTPSAAGSIPVINDIPVPEIAQYQPEETERRVIVEGLDSNAAISAETARSVIESIGEAMGDGVVVRFR